MRRSATILALSVALALVPGCGGEKAAPVPVAPAAPPAQPAGSKFTVDYFNPGFPPVQVEVIQAGAGRVAKMGDMVKMHYTAKVLGKDKPYASSRQEGSTPKEFGAGMGSMGVVPGWDAAALHMRVGDIWRLTIPPELGYGNKGGPSVPKDSTVVFEVEMLSLE